MPAAFDSTESAEQEIITITQQLIRLDTTNFGDDTGPGEMIPCCAT